MRQGEPHERRSQVAAAGLPHQEPGSRDLEGRRAIGVRLAQAACSRYTPSGRPVQREACLVAAPRTQPTRRRPEDALLGQRHRQRHQDGHSPAKAVTGILGHVTCVLRASCLRRRARGDRGPEGRAHTSTGHHLTRTRAAPPSVSKRERRRIRLQEGDRQGAWSGRMGAVADRRVNHPHCMTTPGRPGATV